MRTLAFIALAIIILSCSSAEKTAEKFVAPVSSSRSISVDSIFTILRKNDLVKSDRQRMKVSIVTENLLDIKNPSKPTNYVAVLIEYKESRPTNIAVFDSSNDMNLVTVLEQEFPDVITYVNDDGGRVSGQGPDLTTRAVKLSDAGDVISITVKSAKQFVQGSDDDEDVWLFGLWRDEIVMLMGYSQKFHHLDTSNKGWSENTWFSNEFTVAPTKSKGMYDILLNGHRKVSSDTKSDNEEVDTSVRYIFNGKEYIEI